MAFYVKCSSDPGCYELVDDCQRPVEPVNRFLSALDVRGLSRETVRAYAFDLVVLYRWLKRAERTLEALTVTDLLAFVAAQKAEGAHPHSINRRLATCRQLYRFLTDRQLDASYGSSMPMPNPMARRRDYGLGIYRIGQRSYRRLTVKAPRMLVEPLRPTQVQAFLRRLKRYRDLAIVYLMLFCGLRSREVIGLKLKDISFEEKQLRVLGKGNKQRILPLPDVLRRCLSDYLRLERPCLSTSEMLFVVLQGKRRGQPMTKAGLRSLFRHRRKTAQLANANPHRFRHSFGAEMARSGVRLYVLKEMMGHARAQNTLQYITLSMSDIAKEYRRAIASLERRYASLEEKQSV